MLSQVSFFDLKKNRELGLIIIIHKIKIKKFLKLLKNKIK